MTWHLLLQDILGIKVSNKFVSVIKHNHEYKCITKDGMYPVKYKEAFEVYLLSQQKFVTSSARSRFCEDLELVFDFKNQRVLFTADPHIIILSDKNEYLDDELCPDTLIHQAHWFDEVNHISRVKDYEGNVDAQIVNLKRWRDKLLAVG
jgi:hypothetical protein